MTYIPSGLSIGLDCNGYQSPTGHTSECPLDMQVARLNSVSWISSRLTWGSLPTQRDANYPATVAEARTAGIQVVGYAWLDPRIRDGRAQADNFLNYWYQHPGDIPMLDLEDTSTIKAYPGIDVYIRQWLEQVEITTGIAPWVYLNPSYSQMYLNDNSIPLRFDWLRHYPLFTAQYTNNSPYALYIAGPTIPTPWYPWCWAAWQFTRKGDARSFGYRWSTECAISLGRVQYATG